MLDPLSVNVPLGTTTVPRPILPIRRLLQPSPDHPDDYILEWDYSAASEFLVCNRRAENKFVKCREADKDSSPTEFGQLFHTIEELRRVHGGYTPEVKVEHERLIDEHFLAHPTQPTDHRTAERMRSVLKLYYEKFALDGIEAKIYRDEQGSYVERPYKLELCTIAVRAQLPFKPEQLCNFDGQVGRRENSGWYASTDKPDSFVYDRANSLAVRNIHIVLTGRIDLVLEEAGQLWVWDDKTTSRGGAEFSEWFRLSLQTRGYCYAIWKLLGRMPIGAIINAAVIRKLTKTGTGTEFNRQTYFYNEDSILEYESNMKAHAEDFVNCLVRGYFPQTALSYQSPCTYCDYKENCVLPVHQRAADLATNLYRNTTWNPMH